MCAKVFTTLVVTLWFCAGGGASPVGAGEFTGLATWIKNFMPSNSRKSSKYHSTRHPCIDTPAVLFSSSSGHRKESNVTLSLFNKLFSFHFHPRHRPVSLAGMGADIFIFCLKSTVIQHGIDVMVPERIFGAVQEICQIFECQKLLLTEVEDCHFYNIFRCFSLRSHWFCNFA